MKNLENLELTLREKGYKLTEQRRIIIRAFLVSPGHHTAQEILDMVRESCKDINFSTIYRNLEMLCRLDIINKLQIESGISHYELNGLSHHHHIICKKCGETKEIDVCPYASLEDEQLESLGFKATDHKFEIYGYCSKCRMNGE